MVLCADHTFMTFPLPGSDSDLDPCEILDLREQVALSPFHEWKVDAGRDINFGQDVVADSILDEEGIEPEALDADKSISLASGELDEGRETGTRINPEAIDVFGLEFRRVRHGHRAIRAPDALDLGDHN